MTSIRIIYRPSSSPSGEGGKLSLRILHQRRYKLIATGLSLREEEWDNIYKCPHTYTNNPDRQEALRHIGSKLEFQIQQLLSIVDKFSKKGAYTVDDIQAQYKLRSEKNSFYPFVEVLSRELTRQGRERTARAYRSVCKRFVKFNKGKDLPLHHLNTLSIHRFEKQLKEEGLRPNTTSFYMRNLRAIYNKAISHGFITTSAINPFIGVFTGLAPTVKRALTVEELTQLKKLDLSSLFTHETREKRQLSQAKDLFLFSFHARGMSFVDIAFLKKKNLKDGVITYCRRKTGQQLDIAITDSLQELIDRYKSVTENSPYVFPIITNPHKSDISQYMQGLSQQNRQLKRLGELARIKKNLTSHMARHSWATIAKSSNLPLWVISESLGHSSVKTTYIYLGSFNRSVLDEANEKVSLAVGF